MLVSAIIPTYNRAKTIQGAVDSVLAQTWKEMEVIVVDDGSTDQTDEVLRAYGDKIRVIRQKNGGPSAARNTGIKAATGEIVTFLDSDDAWLPLKTERQIKLLQRTESSGVVCCVCNARMLFKSGEITSFQSAGLYPNLAEGLWSNPADILIGGFLFFNQVVAIRREFLENVGCFREDLRFNEDYEMALRLSLTGPWGFIADPLVVWREHVDNISRTHGKLEICENVLQILSDLRISSRFGKHFPNDLLRRQMRILREEIFALRLAARPNALIRVLGKFLLLFLRGRAKLTRRLPWRPKMATTPIVVGKAPTKS
jgi:glycosyltransferase involved in cell wall biosynthesis